MEYHRTFEWDFSFLSRGNLFRPILNYDMVSKLFSMSHFQIDEKKILVNLFNMTLTHICGVHRLSVTTLSSLRMINVAFTQGETAAAVCSSLLPLLSLYLVTQRLLCSSHNFHFLFLHFLCRLWWQEQNEYIWTLWTISLLFIWVVLSHSWCPKNLEIHQL